MYLAGKRAKKSILKFPHALACPAVRCRKLLILARAPFAKGGFSWNCFIYRCRKLLILARVKFPFSQISRFGFKFPFAQISRFGFKFPFAQISRFTFKFPFATFSRFGFKFPFSQISRFIILWQPFYSKFVKLC